MRISCMAITGQVPFNYNNIYEVKQYGTKKTTGGVL
jgi:hypothetical protein